MNIVVAGCEKSSQISGSGSSAGVGAVSNQKSASPAESGADNNWTREDAGHENVGDGAHLSKSTTSITITNRGFNGTSVYAAAALPSAEIGQNGSCEWSLYNGSQKVITMATKMVGDSRNATCLSLEFSAESIRARGVAADIWLHLVLNYESNISVGSIATDPFQVNL
ncbi:MAG: hypothetical protein LBP35_00010 [Candidatus Ancillula trichonymphae]|jgi:hypothetical protein|nr:hypothetical protein [Candidatus Ancillula trichonymphae]